MTGRIPHGEERSLSVPRLDSELRTTLRTTASVARGAGSGPGLQITVPGRWRGICWQMLLTALARRVNNCRR
jgi:hypothetical protein